MLTIANENIAIKFDPKTNSAEIDMTNLSVEVNGGYTYEVRLPWPHWKIGQQSGDVRVRVNGMNIKSGVTFET